MAHVSQPGHINDMLLPPFDGEPGNVWLSDEMLRRQNWTDAAIGVLVPENILFPEGVEAYDWEPLYHRAQVEAVRATPFLGKATISTDWPEFWRQSPIRDRVVKLQRQSRPDAQDDADLVRERLRAMFAASRQGTYERKEDYTFLFPAAALEPGDDAPPPISLSTRVDVLPRQRPAPSEPLSPAQQAREYERLVRLTEDRQAATRGQRRAGSARPVRLSSAHDAVILRSGGRCENPHCGGQPEDLTDAGLPLLDVDHIDELGAGGEDSPANMITLCPNCHRIKTFGRTRHELTPILREVARQRHADLLAIRAEQL
ncbi:HNH endonuclease signature motif containing protein [Streptomyces sp. RerS4]|uniref:HNH endonuclease signature motif containing protein n=1 Tax=Streptomyces sp. RerS4 TaxID=2942449 RepID=UPI00201C968B|nr:HNH endonuclease signature motif containing protein [Streptomyces sp. RerS4]UQX04580.1 HNH endonuclease [Streptomyces sp. RerS4]